MKKVNLEKKINLALNEAVNALRVCEDLDFNTRDNYCKYAFTRIVSILCMVDDWEIEDRCSYYCLSEIDRNLVNFIDERKMKSYENVNK